jgi:plasmid replication initiation protein
MEKKKNDIVKQSNALARTNLNLDDAGTRGKLDTRGNSPWLERVLYLTMAHIKTADFDFQQLNIPVSEMGIAGKKLSGKDYRDIKTVLTDLIRSYYSIENPVEQNFKVCAVFSELEYKRGVISATFNKAMKPHLLQLTESFTTFEFSEFRRLGTAYAQKLYRFLKSWRNVPEVIIPLEQLHKTLGITTSLKKYTFFKMRVLEPAHTEITGQTRFWYEWEPVKTKNKVTAIRFFFRARTTALPAPEDTAKKAKGEIDKLQSETTACFFAHQDRGVECTPKRTKRCKYCATRGVKYVKDSAKRQKELEAGASA